MRNGKLVWIKAKKNMVSIVGYDTIIKTGIPILGSKFWIPADSKLESL